MPGVVYLVSIYLPTIVERNYKEKPIFLSLTLRNVPGIIAKIAKILSENNVNILYGIHSVEKHIGYWIFLAEFSDAKKPLGQIIEEIKSMEGVLEINYGIDSVGDMLINPFPFTITLPYGIGRASIIPITILKKAVSDLREKWGIAASVFLYHVGYHIGETLGNMFKEKSFGYEEILKASLEYLKYLNLFKDYSIKFFSLINNAASIKIYDSFECENVKSDKPVSHFLRGILGGILFTIFRKEITVYETKCIAKGDKFCEYTIKQA
ncbi:MAG: hypothetical protein DRO23_04285 [Thermoprotei archaeon]|nr:MAG: hypothetical protein DRO23_04285 [Thermoprotei archaeon]